LAFFCQARDSGFSKQECEMVVAEVVRRFDGVLPKDHPYTEDEARWSLEQAFGRAPREPWLRDGAFSVPYSAIRPEAVGWVIHQRVPQGMLTILAGDPGLGKSQLTVHWAARISTGSILRAAGDVLVLSAEDSPAMTTAPRLQAAGADLGRVRLLKMRKKGEESGVTIPDDIAEIEREIRRRQAELAILDPLNAMFRTGVNSWRDTDVRGVLGPLSALCERTGAALVAVMHLTKASGGGEAIYRVQGSIGYTAQARSVLLLTRDPDDPQGERGTRRVLAHAKCNVGPLAPSLLYEIRPTSLPSGIETSCLERIGESPYGAKDLLEMSRTRSRGDRKLDQAQDLLAEELADGDWHPVASIRAKAKFRKVSPATLDRAKRELGIEHRVGSGFPARHDWRLSPPPSGALIDLFPQREGRRDDAAEGRGRDEVDGPSGQDDPGPEKGATHD
jgi:hypothetical protein